MEIPTLTKALVFGSCTYLLALAWESWDAGWRKTTAIILEYYDNFANVDNNIAVRNKLT